MEIRRSIGADSLGYLSYKDLTAGCGLRPDFGYCTACFTGKTPIHIPKEIIIN